MSAGDRIYHRQAGGGGWGSPMDRDTAAVARDVKNGRVSLSQARQQYGVVMDGETLSVNEEETGNTRRRMSAPGTAPDDGNSG